MTFIDDSPPLQTWGANNTVVENLEESDRSSGRVVLGTAAGDLYIFIQRGVRLIPREVRRIPMFFIRAPVVSTNSWICSGNTTVVVHILDSYGLVEVRWKERLVVVLSTKTGV